MSLPAYNPPLAACSSLNKLTAHCQAVKASHSLSLLVSLSSSTSPPPFLTTLGPPGLFAVPIPWSWLPRGLCTWQLPLPRALLTQLSLVIIHLPSLTSLLLPVPLHPVTLYYGALLYVLCKIYHPLEIIAGVLDVFHACFVHCCSLRSENSAQQEWEPNKI